MLTPTNPDRVPSGGWSVDIPDAGPSVTSPHIADFKRAVHRRLEANGLDRPDWWAEIQDLMCRQRPDIPCEDKDAPPQRDATGEDARRWIRTMYEAWESGARPVSDEEQDRRAAICMKCPKKGVVNCIGGCGAIAEALGRMITGIAPRHIPELLKRNCLVCGCELSSMTRYPLEVLQAVDAKVGFKNGEYPEFCWKAAQPSNLRRGVL